MAAAVVVRHQRPTVPAGLLLWAVALAGALAGALVLQSVAGLAQGVREGRPAAAPAVVAAPAATPLALREGPAAGEVTVWFQPGTSREAIQAWAAGYELTEVGANLVWLGHVYRLPAIEVAALDGGRALVRFPLLADAGAIHGYLAANRLRLVRWVREVEPGWAAGHRVAEVELPRLEVRLRDLGAGLYEAALPGGLGLSEADVRQLVAEQAPGYELVSWDEATGRLVLSSPAPVAAAAPVVISYAAPAAAPHRPATVPVYAQFRAGTLAAEMQAVSSKFGLQAAGAQLGVGSFVPDRVNGILQLLSDEPSVACAALSASACSVNPLPAPAASAPAPAVLAPAAAAAAPLPLAALAAPGGLTASAADGHVSLGWQAVAGGAGYRVYRQAAGGAPQLLATASEAAFTDTGGTAGTAYGYQVAAVTAGGAEGPLSPAVSTTWVPVGGAPQVLQVLPATAQVVMGTVRLEVQARTGDGRGRVDWQVWGARGTQDLGGAPVQASPNDPLAWTADLTWDSTQVPDGTYTLTVTVTGSTGAPEAVSGHYRVQNGPPPAPTGLSAAAGPGGVALSWQQPEVAAAAYYRLTRDGQPLADLASDRRSYMDGAPGAGQHTYALVLYDGAGRPSQAATAAVAYAGQPVALVVPQLSVLTPAGERMQPEGRAPERVLLVSEAATGFEYRAGAGAWRPVPGTMSSGVLEWQLPGAAGRYLVMALGAGGAMSAPFALLVAPGPALAAPGQPVAALTPGGVALHWTMPAGVLPAGYEVLRDGGLLDRVARAAYEDDEAGVGVRHTYLVRALDGDGGEGEPSAPVAVTVPRPAELAGAQPPVLRLAAPAALEAQAAAGHVSLRWQPVPGADRYRVERSWQADGPWAPVGVTPLALYVDRAPPLGGEAWYRVRALGGEATAAVPALLVAGRAAQPSPAGSVLPQPPAAVAMPQAVVLAEGVRVSWQVAQGAGQGTTYDVYRYDPAALSFELAATHLIDTSYLDAGLAAGGYGYVVTALDGYGQESGYSAAAWLQVPAMAPVLAVPETAPAGASVGLAADGGAVTFEVAPAGGAFVSLGGVREPAPAQVGGAGAAPATGGAWTANWNTSGLPSGLYTLRARFADAAGRLSETVRTLRLEAPPARGPPAAEFTLQATPTAGGIGLAWSGATGARVQVLRSAGGPDGPYEAVAQTSGQRYEDRHLVPGGSYTYVVESAGAFSQPAQAAPLPGSTSSGAVRVELPAASRSRLTLDLAPSPTPPALPAGLTLVGSAYSIEASSLATGSAVHLLNETAALSLQAPAGSGRPLTIYHWDGGRWVAETTMVDPASGLATAQVTHFSLFALASGSESAAAGQAPPPPASPSQFSGSGQAPAQALPQLPPAPPAVQVAPDGEATSLRTASSRTYRNPDGTFKRVVSAGLVNYQDASGAWQAIDSRLVAAGDGTQDSVNAAGPMQVRLPQDLSQRPVVVSSGGVAISMRLQGAQSSTLGAAGYQGSYASALPGVDAQYQVVPEGVRERLVLRAAPAGPLTFTYLLDTSAGLTLAARADGSVSGLDGAGQEQLLIPAPALEEAPAATGVGAFSRLVAVALSGGSGHYQLTYTPNAAWLADPARRYPVVLDPSVTLGHNNDESDAQIASGAYADTNFTGLTYLPIGNDPNGSTYRALIWFSGQVVCGGCWPTSATLSLYQYTNYRSGSAQIAASVLTAGWATNTVTWNNAPGYTGPSTYAQTLNGTGWVSLDATGAVRNWETHTAAQDGFMMTSASEGCGCNNDELFRSGAYSDPTLRPQLVINYDTYLAAMTAFGTLAGSWAPVGGTLQGEVAVRNDGTATWDTSVRLSYRWMQNGNALTSWTPRVYLPYNVPTNDTTVLRFPVSVPNAASGSGLVLQLSLTREGVFWLYQLSWGSDEAALWSPPNTFVAADESATIAASGTLPPAILAQPATLVSIPLTLTNTSTYYTWKASDLGDPVRVSMQRYRDIAGTLVSVPNAAMTWLLANVGPGGQQTVAAVLQAPADPGDYWLRIDLLRGTSTWFESRGNQPLEVHVRVQGPGDSQAAQAPVVLGDGSSLAVNTSNGYVTLSATDLSVQELGATRLLLARAYSGVSGALNAANATYGTGWTFDFQRAVQLGAWPGAVSRGSAGIYTDARGRSWPLTWNPGRGLWEDAAGDQVVAVTGAADAVPVDQVRATLAADASAPRGQALVLGSLPAALVFPSGRVPFQQSGTIELWVRPDFNMSTDTAEHDLFADTTGRYKLAWNAGGGTLRKLSFATTDGDTGTTTTVWSGAAVTWTQGSWHHVAVTWQQGVGLTMVVDQASPTTSAASYQSPNGDVYFGYAPAGAAFPLVGAIAELRIENLVLGSSQEQADGVPGTLLSGDSHTLYLGTFVNGTGSAAGFYTVTNPDQSQEDYAPDMGRLVAERDRFGNQVDYTWDSQGRISRIADHALSTRALTFSYGWGSFTVTDPGGRTVTYTVNGSADLTSVTRSNQVPDPITGAVTSQPATTSYAYQGLHALQQVTDPRNAHTTIGYVDGYAATVLGDGPNVYLRLGDPSGTTAVDAVSRASNGIVSGGVTLGAAGLLSGDSDPGMSFDGSTGTVAVDVPTIDTTSGHQVTVELWLKWSGSGSTLIPFGFYGYDLDLSTTGGFGFNTGNSDLYGVAPSAVPANTPLHVVAVFTNGGVISNQLYLNGVLQTLSQRQGSPLTRSVSATANISGWGFNSTLYGWSGTLDEVAVYNGALPAARVSAHYSAAAGYRSAVLADSPLAYWRLDETAGRLAYDSSRGLDQPLVVGGVTFGVPGALSASSDTAVTLNGTTGEIDTWYTQYAATAYSVEAWVKTTDAGQHRAIVEDRGSGSGVSLTLGLYPTNGAAGDPFFELESNSLEIGVYSTAAVNNGQWHHLVGTWSGGNLLAVSPGQFALYVDGVAVSLTTISGGSASGPLTGLGITKIGAHDAWGTHLNGSLDEVAIYADTVLSPAQVLAHFQAASTSILQRVAWLQDGRGSTALTLAYDDRQAMTTVTDAVGRRSYFQFQAPGGRTTSYTDPAGNTTSYVWDAGHPYRLVATIDPTGVRHSRVVNGAAPVGQQSQTLLEDVAGQPADTLVDWVTGNAALPSGAAQHSITESWIWDSTQELRPGITSHVSTPEAGLHEHWFDSANISVPAGATTATQWVYLQASDVLPGELMIQFLADGAWKGAFWGDDVIPYGTAGTSSRRFINNLPPAGRWVPLSIPLGPSGVDVAGRTLSGLAWTVNGGRVSVWWGPTTFDFGGPAVADPQRSVTRYAYDQLNDQVAAVDPNGIATVDDYDTSGLLRQVSTGMRPAAPVLLFEDPLSSSAAWTFESSYSGTSTGTSTTTYNGLGSLTQTATWSTVGSDLYHDVTGLNPGSQVRVTAWVQTSAGGLPNGGAGLIVDDELGAIPTARQSALVQPAAGTWVQLSVPFVVDSSGKVRIRLLHQALLGTTTWADVRVEDITPAPDITFQRSRAIYTSDFEDATERSAWTNWAATSATFDMPAGIAHGGLYSAHISSSQGSGANDQWTRTLSVVPGTALRLTAWVRTLASGSTSATNGTAGGAVSLEDPVGTVFYPISQFVQTQGLWQLVTLDTSTGNCTNLCPQINGFSTLYLQLRLGGSGATSGSTTCGWRRWTRPRAARRASPTARRCWPTRPPPTGGWTRAAAAAEPTPPATATPAPTTGT